ncbi:hypothetical protein PILCRDRAFT_49114, partial [Piloderma croceum F 1598]
MLLWIKGSLTPQEIRDRIMDPDSPFQKEMVEYLKSVHMGEFFNGKMHEIKEKIDTAELDNNYVNPTETLPLPPPEFCDKPNCQNCKTCNANLTWDEQFKQIVDDIIFRSNVHNVGCLSNKWGKCKARFPRQTYEQTQVDPETGALNIKKGEPMLNNVTGEVTYLIRSNSDVTSLLSGTAIKAVVAYISDYISKPSLKTYLIFEAIKSVIDK